MTRAYAILCVIIATYVYADTPYQDQPPRITCEGTNGSGNDSVRVQADPIGTWSDRINARVQQWVASEESIDEYETKVEKFYSEADGKLFYRVILEKPHRDLDVMTNDHFSGTGYVFPRFFEPLAMACKLSEAKLK